MAELFSWWSGHVAPHAGATALRSFEAAARHESFTRAAEELSLTQGAVSHQVKALEQKLGVKLFHREHQRLKITEPAREYLAVIRDAFDRIAVGTERLVQRQSAGALTISTSPDFAAKWLVHRIGRFAEAHPNVDLRVSAAAHDVDFAREESISRSATVTATGRGSTSSGYPSSSFFRCAAPNSSRAGRVSPSRSTC